MNTNGQMIYGNLALAAYPAARPATPRLSVVEGGRRPLSDTVPAPHREQSASPRGAVAFALIGAVALFAIAAVVGWSVVTSRSAFVHNSFISAPLQEVTVSSGDSLWSIAEDHPLADVTTDELSGEIASYNDIEDVVLMPGETLLVPSGSHSM